MPRAGEGHDRSFASARKRLAIVSQDPAHQGGVLSLARYIYDRAEAVGAEPTIVHYGAYANHPGLSVSLANFMRGRMRLSVKDEAYYFQAMRSHAIGASFPEWEPWRLASNDRWNAVLDEFDGYLLVTGSAQTGLPLAELDKRYCAWVSATVADDRRERLKTSRSFASGIERMGLSGVLSAETRVLRAADKLIAVSNDAATQIEQIANTRPEVWPYPIDTKHFTQSDRSSTFETARILFVGRSNDPRKNIAGLVAAVIEAKKQDAALQLSVTILSAVRPDASLVARLESAGCPVTWIERVTEAELVTLYQTHALLVVTSEQEGLGIAAMEAMACGVPVISTCCGGPETFIQDGVSGFLTSFRPEEIGGRIVLLLSDSAKLRLMGKAARHRIESDFSRDVWDAKFNSLILDAFR